MKRIYQIGFNRCGTVSLHNYFLGNGVKSLHWQRGKLSEQIFRNHREQKPLFEGFETYTAFTDMEHHSDDGEAHYAAEELFREMHRQDPEGLFVLNVRPIEDWIKSLINHQRGEYLRLTMAFHNRTANEVLDFWRSRFNRHKQSVIDYFAGKDTFLLFDISEHSAVQLTEFFNKHGFAFSDEHWRHLHKSRPMATASAKEKHINQVRAAAMYFFKVEKDLVTANSLMEQVARLRPEGTFIQKQAAILRELTASETPE